MSKQVKFFEITTQIPHEVYLALKRGAEPPRLDHPPLRFFWFTDRAFTEGIEIHEVDNVPVRVYSPEKTIVDCFKYRNKLGLDVAIEVAVIQGACLQDVEPDGLSFDEKSVDAERIIEDADYEGVRVRFRCVLDTARCMIQLDVAFGDVISPSSLSIIFPTLLDMPAPRLQGYSMESTIAEKFEAMVKLGVLNSRMKDFYDIWLLSRRFDFHGTTLAIAVAKTFSNRRTELPPHLDDFMDQIGQDPSKSAQWRGFVRKTRLGNVPAEFQEVITAVGRFLCPAATALAQDDPFGETWKAPGPWSEHAGEGS